MCRLQSLRDCCGEGLSKLADVCRSALYDDQILSWIKTDLVKGELAAEDANMEELSRRLINRCLLLSSQQMQGA